MRLTPDEKDRLLARGCLRVVMDASKRESAELVAALTDLLGAFGIIGNLCGVADSFDAASAAEIIRFAAKIRRNADAAALLSGNPPAPTALPAIVRDTTIEDALREWRGAAATWCNVEPRPTPMFESVTGNRMRLAGNELDRIITRIASLGVPAPTEAGHEAGG